MSQRVSTATIDGRRSVTPRGSVQLLLVDDQPANLLALEAILEDLGPALVEVRSGEDALRRLLHEDFAAVLLDVQMQGLDGFETARLIRSRERSRHTPILFMTAYESNRLSAEEAYGLGAVDYLVKPILPVVLRAKVAQFVELFEKTEQVRRQADQLREWEQKRAEQLLRDSHARHTAILETALDAIITIGPDGKVMEFNPAAERMFGYRRDQILGRPMVDAVIPTRLRDTHLRGLAHYQATGESSVLNQRVEVTACRANGTEFPVELAVTRISMAPPLFTAHIRDITERVRSAKVRAQLAALVEQSQDAILSKSLEGIIETWNSAAERLYGYSAIEAIGQHIQLLIPPERVSEHQNAMARLARGEQVLVSETVRRRKDGTLVDVSTSMSPIRDRDGEMVGSSIIARDITDLKRLEEQFRQAQKMESIGRLAGGVAHDFNNLLTAIVGYSEFLLESTSLESTLRSYAEEIKGAAERATSLTRQLLAFSRKQVLAPQIIDLNALIARMGPVLRRMIGHDVELATMPASAAARVRADPSQVEQVIMNLVVNARDAMPSGGTLTISTEVAAVDEPSVHGRAPIQPGPYVLVRVTDTGCGMDEHTKAHLFEPFFTTKEVGKGTGLGLATVYGIVTQSGGQVEMTSELGHGTTCTIYFPCVEGPSAEEASLPPSVRPVGGAETVLVVEDESIVRNLIRAVLVRKGYRVLEAAGGEEALAVCERHPGPIDLLVTDVTMPRLNGREVAERVTQMRPATKVLYVSGHTEDVLIRQGSLRAEATFLQKPFGPDALTGTMRALLDGEGRGS